MKILPNISIFSTATPFMVIAMSFALSACLSNHSMSPRSTSTYDTTGFGDSRQRASNHAIENAQRTCGNLPVTVVSDDIRERQYRDQTTKVFEVNVRYRCGN